MNAVKDKIIALVGEELAAANAIYPPFHSTHEGYAVMLEEIDEVKEALDFVDFDRGLMWEYIRQDAPDDAMRNAQDIEKQAVHLAAEAIQVAAMARKFQAIGKDMSATTIEAEPVRHGKWVLCEGFRICNGCGASPADWEQKPNNPSGLPPYCHSCGAKMDLEG